MLEADFYGKLLPTNPDIKQVLESIRSEYSIPEISPQDDSLRVLLRHELEINWKAVHAEILQRLKDLPDRLPESMMKAYRACHMFTKKGIVDPELKDQKAKLAAKGKVLDAKKNALALNLLFPLSAKSL